jgi:hypothetical protein
MLGGCFRRVGCLVVFVVAALAAWMTRDMWWGRVTGREVVTEVKWTRVSAEPATDARRRVTALSQPSGAAYATLTPSEVAAMILAESGGRIPASITDVEAAAVGDRLSVRATVDLSDLRSVEGLGPVRQLLTGRQRVTLTGTPVVAAQGQGRFHIDDLKVGQLSIPRPLISRVLAQIDRDNAPSGAERPAITFPLPRYIGDIRVSNGQVTLYKSAS